MSDYKDNKSKYIKYGNKIYNTKPEAEKKKIDLKKKGYVSRLYYNPHTKKYEILVKDVSKTETKQKIKTNTTKKLKIKENWKVISDKELFDILPTKVVSYSKEYIAEFNENNRNFYDIPVSNTFLKKFDIGMMIEFREGGSHCWNYAKRYLKIANNKWLYIYKKNFPSRHCKTRSALNERQWMRQISEDIDEIIKEIK